MNLYIPGIATGLLLFAAILWVEKKLMNAFKLNPLLHLGLLYLIFYWAPDFANDLLPPLWKSEQIESPFQLDGTLGSILRLNKPQMSVVDLAFCVFLVCLIGRFIYTLTAKKYLWGQIDDKKDQ
ncbi:hypothetical protein [Flagellimonas iocasae]|uniref:Uncharacterized protein n=1 Tax=Flagellimonas iocasae TaxID=2055905 RepID=A0ABW4XYP4_9FLAO